MFDIRTPKGFIDPETSIEIELLHVPGILLPRNDVHHFSVYYIKCDTEAQVSFIKINYRVIIHLRTLIQFGHPKNQKDVSMF